MKVTVEKIDDINIILSGLIENKTIEERFAQLKEQESSQSQTDEKIQEECRNANS